MLSRSERKHFKSTTHSGSIDLPLLITVIILVVLGLIMVYDSSVAQAFKDFGDNYFYIKQQLVWVVLGLLAMFFFSKFNYHFLKGLSLPIFAFALILLLAVLIPGLQVEGGGAHRWLKLG